MSNDKATEMSTKHIIPNDLKYFTFFENKRVVTIACRINLASDTDNIAFAASIFHEADKTDNASCDKCGKRRHKAPEVYVRRRHIKTARNRLLLRPLFGSYDISDDDMDSLHKIPKSSFTVDDFKSRNALRANFYENLSKTIRRWIHESGVGSTYRLKVHTIPFSNEEHWINY